MTVGGVEKAFLGLLSAIPLDKYEVHLGLLQKKGDYLKLLPKEVHVHDIDVYRPFLQLIDDPPQTSLKRLLRQRHFIEAVIHLLLYMHYKLTGSRKLFYRYIMRHVPPFPMTFDLAVAYAGPSQMTDFYVCRKVRAKHKCGWIHFDVSRFGIDKGMARWLYPHYDKIFIVSHKGKRVFDHLLPSLKEKSEVFYNILSPEQITSLSLSGPTFCDGFTGNRILTLGRVSQEKGQTVALKAAELLKKAGVAFRWYFIGTGTLLARCEQLRTELHLEEEVVFLGLQINPYAFLKDCDVYVQPSRHEGFCLSLAEALCFGMPIVSTDFTGAREQLSHRDNAIISDMDAKSLSENVQKALSLPRAAATVPQKTDIKKLLSLIQEG